MCVMVGMVIGSKERGFPLPSGAILPRYGVGASFPPSSLCSPFERQLFSLLALFPPSFPFSRFPLFSSPVSFLLPRSIPYS